MFKKHPAVRRPSMNQFTRGMLKENYGWVGVGAKESEIGATRGKTSGPPIEEPEGVSCGLFALRFHDGGLQLFGRHGTWQYGGVFSGCARGWHHHEARRAAEA